MTYDEYLRLLDAPVLTDDERDALLDPQRREFFGACRNFLLQVTDSKRAAASFADPRPLFDKARASEFQQAVAQMHSDVVQAMTEQPFHHRPSTAAVEEIETRWKPKLSLPLGFYRDLVEELRSGEQDQTPPVPVRSQEELSVPSRVSARSARIHGLLVPKGSDGRLGEGMVAQITVELVKEGRGDLYPNTALASVARSPDWMSAERAVQEYLQETLKVWLAELKWDVRWGLRQGVASVPTLSGNSAGAALALAILWLLVRQAQHEGRSVLPKDRQALADALLALEEAELGEIACSATLDEQGRLGVVGAIDNKFGERLNLMGLRREIRSVVLHQDQKEVFLEGYENPGLRPLLVLKAATIEEAVVKLAEESAPRRAVRKVEEAASATIRFLTHAEVPMGTGYQPLPMLRRLSREEIERIRKEERKRQQEQGERPDLTTPRMWRETEPSLDPAYEYDSKPVSLAEVLEGRLPWASGRKGAVVLAEPGGGKSTFTRRVAWLTATGEAPSKGRRLLPVRVELGSWAKFSADTGREADAGSLVAYLVARHPASSQIDGPNGSCWQRWLERGELLLLFDGLDEAASHITFVRSLGPAASGWSKAMPVVVTCRTGNFGTFEGGFAGLAVLKLDAFEREAIRSFVRAYPVANGKLDPEKLIRHVESTPCVGELAGIPFLLDLICLVASRSVELPSRRSELYDAAIDVLLDPKWIPDDKGFRWPSSAPEVGELRRVLEWAALELMLADPAANWFTRGRFLEALKHGWEQIGEQLGINDKARALRDYVSGPVRLVFLADEGGGFSHRGLLEFLAADCLASEANTTGWDRQLSVYAKEKPLTPTLRQLVDRKSWDPAWAETIVLMSGRLTDPQPLLTLLWDESTDAWARPRLHLTGKCLPELRPRTAKDIRTAIESQIDYFRTAFYGKFQTVLGHMDDCFAPIAARHIAEQLRSDPQQGVEMLKAVADESDRAEAIRWHIGELCERNGVLVSLAHNLQASEPEVRCRTAHQLAIIGASVATEAVLHQLIQRLSDAEADVRAAAAYALGRMAPRPAGPCLIARLLQLLTDSSWKVRGSAAFALGRLSVDADAHLVVPHLINLLSDYDSSVACTSLRALERIAEYSPSVSERVVNGITNVCGDANLSCRGLYRQRKDVCQVLGSIGATVADERAIDLMWTILLNGEPEERDAAVDALERLCTRAVMNRLSPKIALSWLMQLRFGAKHAASFRAAVLLSRTAGPHVRREVLRELDEWYLSCTRERVSGLKDAALDALWEAGGLTATRASLVGQCVVQRLTDKCTDSQWDVREKAAIAIARRCTSKWQVFATSKLLKVMRARSVMESGLQYGLQYYAWRAAAALLWIGQPRATRHAAKELLYCVGGGHDDADQDDLTGAARALGQMMQRGFRFLKKNGEWCRVARVERLSRLAGEP